MGYTLMLSIDEKCEEFRNFGHEVLSEDVEERDRRGAKDPSDWMGLWQSAALKGVLGINVPQQFGGEGRSFTDSFQALHSLGKGCRDNGMLLGLNGQLWAMQHSISVFGNEHQKAKWLPALVDGEAVCAHAVTETNSGSDVTGIRATAEKTKYGYRLNGEKIWIGMAPAADVAQVFAITNPDHGAWGMSAFIVDLKSPGVSKSAPYDKSGHRTVPTGKLTFENVEIPDESLLGSEGSGHAIFNQSIAWERSFIFSSHLGAMKRQLDETVLFARDRAPNGKPIINNQTVSNRIADMQVRYEISRLLIENAAREIDAGVKNRMTPSVVKLSVAEALLENALEAQRIRGASGYLTGECERMVRDMAGTITLGGTSDIQRLLISAYQKGAVRT
ncbi:acyl-CoA dehydrogenase family protein [Ruegeria arenilitoris]|uniref:acyl-CoA dehydrogenase family protein n=2 Tax=Ruegeria arenilitoris TaxID=1173585 RepID=UPI0014802298|nr:acyl-CoA dehydrogenase family protein [Ruegeria arenilitoris]